MKKLFLILFSAASVLLLYCYLIFASMDVKAKHKIYVGNYMFYVVYETNEYNLKDGQISFVSSEGRFLTFDKRQIDFHVTSSK